MKEFLTAKDVRDRFGLNRTTLWRWEKAGKFIPAKTPGGRRRYAAADLEALLGVQKQPSGQPRHSRSSAGAPHRIQGSPGAFRLPIPG
ncbi:MAG: helix-turn-helix domain-containing protein [Symbiobacteriia bacterium]